ncbi:MAG TPA: DUF4350 domain-containing protein [Terracidiphilus sp.]|jgi:hypothetical protein|nr:DUF4350 domain-containing protein [Terracidiphilus sp.]
MSLFASIAAKDRRLLSICMAAVAALVVLTAVFARNQNNNDNPLPSSYLTGRHGARAAYDMLQASGYSVQRWEDSLSGLAAQANPHTVVILADPILSSADDFKSVQEILKRGGRVLSTGMFGGLILPDSAVQPPSRLTLAACELTPEGLDALAGSGDVWMVPSAGWKLSSPRYRVEYDCGGQPAVVEYDVGAGHAIWWASSTPLENGSIGRAGNLDLFLNSLGSRNGVRVYWDESLHGVVHSHWFYARGAALNMLIAGLAALALLMIFSFSRRSGPVRDVPQPVRATPIEFLEALGSLYQKAGASATAVALAYNRFRRRMSALCGLRGTQMSAADLALALRHRFPQAGADLEADLAAGEEASWDDSLEPRRALALVQALNRHDEALQAMVRAGGAGK